MFLIYILLGIIAVGVLLLSDTGKAILSFSWSALVAGVVILLALGAIIVGIALIWGLHTGFFGTVVPMIIGGALLCWAIISTIQQVWTDRSEFKKLYYQKIHSTKKFFGTARNWYLITPLLMVFIFITVVFIWALITDV